ncbi:hypothetical protein DQ04_00051280 [Trypanosoma grayi]|uniref:hypothetical protein n=1 Tax=Trypanosoma grayi TaxID=71804 RepID=UPI0004F43001|nr:hypothetical protein DQ04_00051280 [Trypanosoma grayi]KEG15533.1 hypothetical protein DQ04_00051280 [Trypanosoma grayi]
MGRDTKAPGKPTLADIVAGRHALDVPPGEHTGTTNRRVEVPETSPTQPLADMNGRSCPHYNIEPGSIHNSRGGVENLGYSRLNVSEREHLQTIFSEENGIRRDNAVRVLKRLGIHPTPSDTELEPFFRTLDTQQSSLSPAQWISLVEHLIDAQGCTFESNANSTGVVTPDVPHHNSEEDQRMCGREGAVTQRSEAKLIDDQGRGCANASAISHLADTANGDGSSYSEERWITGTEEADVALVKLFIHCGALERKGRGMELFLRDFRRMTDLRRNSLPPRRIVWDAVSTLTDWCHAASASTNDSTDCQCMKLPQFLVFIEDELQGLVPRYRGGGTSRHSFPTVCMILAALAPEPLQRICGRDTVEHLRAPETVEYVMRGLEITESLNTTPPEASLKQGRGTGLPPMPPALPLASRPIIWKRQKVRRVPFSSPSTPVVRAGALDSTATATGGGGGGGGGSDKTYEKRGRAVSASVRSRSSTGAQRERRSSDVPRYMEPKRPDEISASIIARSKARRLIDELRKNTIPINRYECFARIEYVQQAMFEDASMSEHDGNSSEEGIDSQGGTYSHRHRRHSKTKVLMPDVSGPLLPGMYRMGGLGRPTTRKARQETFERLYRSRFSCLSGCSSSSVHRSPSSVAATSSVSPSNAEQGAHTSVSPNHVNTEATAPLMSHEDQPASVSAAVTPLYQRRMRGSLTRQNSRPPPMLADIYATRFLSSSTRSQRASSTSTAASTRMTDDAPVQTQVVASRRTSSVNSHPSGLLVQRSSVQWS